MSPSSRSYSIVEPHPSVTTSTHYISTGRGGIGNAVPSSSSSASAWGGGSGATGASRLGSLSSTTSSTASSRKTFTTGRGGAGNVFPSSERAIFSFDEELEQQLRWERDAAPVYHVGRGGAGNIGHVSNTNSNYRFNAAGATNTAGPSAMMRRRPSEDSAASATSASSSHGSESGADQFNRSVKKGWKKITGMGMHHHQ
ncbi:uncharacterized protein Z519_09748 [Cladophialophora bantiana CBS 173.52]|uniref:Uncharacterized protein n=1 Tax=Cladophialophora bantiana (strain ATCC 10958 / CBS 173.52 / CDC B-1940 / NIH 8579) TaxID=1442370 RepID=A0A0D2FSQ8_CLAB1|nr:uncharacterized protein Z519_09748 [Cladophialophora bantiana CBS 173.52]KIW89592.1 hypothetical protein Z519_09748 [Cladophialophora bantiana CBS 173.52]